MRTSSHPLDLEELDLNYNDIPRLPKRLQQLSRLKTLYICYNRLTALPEEIDMPTLRELHLANNCIKVVIMHSVNNAGLLSGVFPQQYSKCMYYSILNAKLFFREFDSVNFVSFSVLSFYPPQGSGCIICLRFSSVRAPQGVVDG